MQERKQIIQLLSSSNPDSIALGWELAANFAPDLMELRKFGEGVFGDDVFCFWMLDMSYNNLTTLPESIGQLKNLTWLSLLDNPIPKAEQSRIRKALPNTKIYF